MTDRANDTDVIIQSVTISAGRDTTICGFALYSVTAPVTQSRTPVYLTSGTGSNFAGADPQMTTENA